jgi:hypothetical protein
MEAPMKRRPSDLWKESLSLSLSPANPVAITIVVDRSTVESIERVAAMLPGNRAGDFDEGARFLLAQGAAAVVLQEFTSSRGDQ